MLNPEPFMRKENNERFLAAAELLYFRELSLSQSHVTHHLSENGCSVEWRCWNTGGSLPAVMKWWTHRKWLIQDWWCRWLKVSEGQRLTLLTPACTTCLTICTHSPLGHAEELAGCCTWCDVCWEENWVTGPVTWFKNINWSNKSSLAAQLPFRHGIRHAFQTVAVIE